MKVILGHVFDSISGEVVGTEYLETDPDKHPLPTHPATGVGKVAWVEWMRHMNDNPQSRENGGWHQETLLAGETVPKQRWTRLCEACNASSAPADIKALKLGAPKGVK